MSAKILATREIIPTIELSTGRRVGVLDDTSNYKDPLSVLLWMQRHIAARRPFLVCPVSTDNTVTERQLAVAEYRAFNPDHVVSVSYKPAD